MRRAWIGVLAVCGALGLPATAAALVQPVTHDGQTLTLRLDPVPLRGPQFEVRVQQAGGAYRTVEAPAERAYLGTVDERPGAVASGIVLPDGTLRGVIYFDRGATWFTRGGAVSDTRGTEDQAFAWPTQPNLGAGRADGAVRAWDAAVDVASDFHADHGGSAAKVLEEVEVGMSLVRAVYLRDAQLVPRLARVVVRTDAASDPYAGDAALGALRDEWRANQRDADRDEVLLLEGSESEIGGGVAYATDFDPDFAYAAQGAEDGEGFSIFARHEIGHNFDVGDNHAGGAEGKTLLEGNAVARFSGPELQTVFDSRDARAGVFSGLGRFTAAPVAPYAGLDLHEAAAGSTSTIDVLANDHDANGDPLTLVSVEATTAAGGTAAVADGKVRYTAPAGGGRDSFRYVIADRCGQTATGVVFARGSNAGGSVPATAFEPTGPAGPRPACPVAAPPGEAPAGGTPAAPTTPIGTVDRAVRARLVAVRLRRGRRSARVVLRAPATVTVGVVLRGRARGRRAFRRRAVVLQPGQRAVVRVRLRRRVPRTGRLRVTATTLGSTLGPARRASRRRS